MQVFDSLGPKNQKEIFVEILGRQKVLAEKVQNALKNKDSLTYKTANSELDIHRGIKYAPLVSNLDKYFRLTNDVKLLQLLFATMWADNTAATDSPYYVTAYTILCYSLYY